MDGPKKGVIFSVFGCLRFWSPTGCGCTGSLAKPGLHFGEKSSLDPESWTASLSTTSGEPIPNPSQGAPCPALGQIRKGFGRLGRCGVNVQDLPSPKMGGDDEQTGRTGRTTRAFRACKPPKHGVSLPFKDQ